MLRQWVVGLNLWLRTGNRYSWRDTEHLDHVWSVDSIMKVEGLVEGSRKLPFSIFIAYEYLTKVLNTPTIHYCTRKYSHIQGWCQWGNRDPPEFIKSGATILFSPPNGVKRFIFWTSLMGPLSVSQAVGPLGVGQTPSHADYANGWC